MRRIRGQDDIAEGLGALMCLDPRLAAVINVAGQVPLRLSMPGFASLVSVVVSQQVSRASAYAMLRRLTDMVAPLDAAAILAADETVFRKAGISRPKQRTILAIATWVANGKLDLEDLVLLDAQEAMARLTAIHGIGPWTAEVYLLFSAGHPDIFPAHDVALQSAVGHAFVIEPRPDARMLYALSEAWAPWRGVAARLFWAYYSEMRGRDTTPPLRTV